MRRIRKIQINAPRHDTVARTLGLMAERDSVVVLDDGTISAATAFGGGGRYVDLVPDDRGRIFAHSGGYEFAGAKIVAVFDRDEEDVSGSETFAEEVLCNLAGIPVREKWTLSRVAENIQDFLDGDEEVSIQESEEPSSEGSLLARLAGPLLVEVKRPDEPAEVIPLKDLLGEETKAPKLSSLEDLMEFSVEIRTAESERWYRYDTIRWRLDLFSLAPRIRGECWSSPQEMEQDHSLRKEGELDICGTPEGESWMRIWWGNAWRNLQA